MRLLFSTLQIAVDVATTPSRPFGFCAAGFCSVATVVECRITTWPLAGAIRPCRMCVHLKLRRWLPSQRTRGHSLIAIVRAIAALADRQTPLRASVTHVQELRAAREADQARRAEDLGDGA